MSLTINMRDPQTLSSGIGLGKATREEGACCLEPVQLERLCGTLIAHPIQLCGSLSQFDSNCVLLRPGFIHNG